jgi:hypothetical protein
MLSGLVLRARFKKSAEFSEIWWDQACMDFQNAVEIGGNLVKVSKFGQIWGTGFTP